MLSVNDRFDYFCDKLKLLFFNLNICIYHEIVVELSFSFLYKVQFAEAQQVIYKKLKYM